MTPAEQRETEEDRAEEQFAQAFFAALGTYLSAVSITEVTRFIRANDIAGAQSAMAFDEAFLGQLADVIRDIFNGSGRRQSAELLRRLRRRPGGRVLVVFNARNLQAEQWVRDRSSRLIQALTDEQRLIIRETLEDGLSQGRNPRRVAVDLLGERIPGTANRSGGVVGLSQAQAGYLRNARAELDSGDPAQLQKYLRRELRDKRQDRTIQKAIREGKPLTRDQVDKIARRYAENLTQARARVIARTESLAAIQAAQHESYRQAVANGSIRADQITKRWRSARDARVRNSHNILHNQEVPFDGVFISPLGSRMRYPLDTSLGARAGDIVQCRCVAEYRVKF